MENFRPGVLDRLGFSVERLHEINPRLVVLVDHRLRPRRARGRPRGLRPDRPGRGRADVLTGPSADEPTQGRRPDRRPARRDVRRLRRRSPRCTSGTRPGAAGSCAPAARGRRRRARLPGHPLDRRRRGAARDRQPAPVDHALRPVPHRRRPGPDRLRQREAVAGAGRAARHRRRPVRHQPGPGRPARRAGRRRSRPRWPPSPPRSGWPGWPTLGIPAGKVRTLDDVYTWDQTLSPGPARRRRPPDRRAASSCPGRRCASTTTRTPGPRTTHLPPPLLGEHDASVRAWLDSDIG